MRRLIQNDWFWVGGATLIATISALVALGSRIEYLVENAPNLILPALVSVTLGTFLPSGFIAWFFFTRTRSASKPLLGLIFGGLSSISAHLLSSIVSAIIFTALGDSLAVSIGYFLWVYGAMIFGIGTLYGLSIFWGAFVGALLGWLYDRTHPTP